MRDTFTEAHANEILRRARWFTGRGELTAKHFVLLESLLRGCNRVRGLVCVTYDILMKRTHMARDTVAKGVARLRALGLLMIEKQRIAVSLAGGGLVWRQRPNHYRFPAIDRESSLRSHQKTQETIYSHCRSSRPSEPYVSRALRQRREESMAWHTAELAREAENKRLTR